MKLISGPARSAIARLPIVLAWILLSLVSGCGLATSNEDQLNRGEQAFVDGDLRAAIIDAKDVLLDEPDRHDARHPIGPGRSKAQQMAAFVEELVQFGSGQSRHWRRRALSRPGARDRPRTARAGPS